MGNKYFRTAKGATLDNPEDGSTWLANSKEPGFWQKWTQVFVLFDEECLAWYKTLDRSDNRDLHNDNIEEMTEAVLRGEYVGGPNNGLGFRKADTPQSCDGNHQGTAFINASIRRKEAGLPWRPIVVRMTTGIDRRQEQVIDRHNATRSQADALKMAGAPKDMTADGRRADAAAIVKDLVGMYGGRCLGLKKNAFMEALTSLVFSHGKYFTKSAYAEVRAAFTMYSFLDLENAKKLFEIFKAKETPDGVHNRHPMRLAYDDPYMRRERKRNRVSALGLPGAGEHDRRERYGRSVCAILRAIGVKKSKKESLWVERWPDKMLIDMLDKMAEIWEDTVTNPDGKPAHLERLNINLNPIDVIYTLQAEARLRKLVVDYARAERNEKSAAKDSRRLDVKDAIEERHLLFKVIREVWAARPKGEEYVPDALDKSVKQLIARHMADFSVG